ncbi:MAG: proton extrusion protein PcxA, partial [Sphaerospermopsis sp. SIO1G2]|nr:proton extrusion protein PcxA [Sphaerospermopsis sp. SIO1G2]
MKRSFLNQKTKFISDQLSKNWHSFNNWFSTTPERAILEAYEAAQAIQKIENEQFDGQKISHEFADYSENVMAFWEGNLNRNLALIKLRLAEFQLGIKFVDISENDVLSKLQFIDTVIYKYNQKNIISAPSIINNDEKKDDNQDEILINRNSDIDDEEILKEPPVTQKTGVFPRSIGRTFNRIANDFAPQAEETFVK